MTTPQAASDALEMPERVILHKVSIPNVGTILSFEEPINPDASFVTGEYALLTAAAQPAPQVIFETPKSEPNLKSSTVFHEAQPATDTTGEAFKRVKEFCDVSTRKIAPFLLDAKKSLDADLKTIESALLSKPAAGTIPLTAEQFEKVDHNLTWGDRGGGHYWQARCCDFTTIGNGGPYNTAEEAKSAAQAGCKALAELNRAKGTPPNDERGG